MANMQIVPACKNVEAQYVEMMVPLYSYGCEKKVKKALSHLKGKLGYAKDLLRLCTISKGIYSVNVDFEQQKVTVWGICNKYNVLASIRSKRKEARFWNSEDNTEEEKSPPSPSPTPSFHRPLALTKIRSLSWRAWKKVFIRSYSF